MANLEKRTSSLARSCCLIALWIVISAPGALAALPSIDPSLRGILRDSPAASFPGLPRSLADPTFTQFEVFVGTVDGADLPVPSNTAVRVVDGLYAMRVDLATLRDLARSDQVRFIRLSRPVRPALDRSTAYIGLGSVRRVNLETGGILGQTGAGVAVGIVDTGIDWSHPDFRDEHGGSRIDRYWDQLSHGTRPPAGFPYGVEFTTRTIDLGLADGIDQVGHGTHVLGIAAGNGRGSFQPGVGRPYAGVAPEATLIIVRSNFTEIGVVLGCRYIMARADALQIPVVINLSLGNHFGPHRGTTPLELGLDELVKAGRLIVAAAGNDGDRAVHAEVGIGDGTPTAVSFDFPSYQEGTAPFVALEGWYPRSDRVRFVVRNPLGTVVGAFEFGNEDVEYVDVKGLVRGWHTEDLGMGTVYIEIEDNSRSERVATGTWRVEIEPQRASAGSEIDFWLANWGGFSNGANPGFTSHVDPGETVISPATAPHVLAVGALATRSCWQDSRAQEVCYASPPPLDEVAFFSSRGPTPDGRPKPEILAPGFGVVSARSSGISTEYTSREELDRLSVPSGLYYLSQGTSMAAPHVTGTTALLLAQYPELTYAQAVGRLTARAKHLEDWRDHTSVLALSTAASLAPMVDVALSELVPEDRGFRLRWSIARTRGPVRYRIYRGFDASGPYTLLSGSRIKGDNPFEILDTLVEPGRTHVYRVGAVDEDTGLEDNILTHTGLWKGGLVPAFRAPDPNPARGPVSFRYFIPMGAAFTQVKVSVFNVAGRRIKDLDPRELTSDGEGIAEWNLDDARGHRVRAGVYFARLEIGGGGEGLEFVRRFIVLP